jgi:hypothetical protein
VPVVGSRQKSAHSPRRPPIVFTSVLSLSLSLSGRVDTYNMASWHAVHLHCFKLWWCRKKRLRVAEDSTHSRLEVLWIHKQTHIHAYIALTATREWLNKGGGEAQRGANFAKASRLRPCVNGWSALSNEP